MLFHEYFYEYICVESGFYLVFVQRQVFVRLGQRNELYFTLFWAQ